MPMLIRTPEEIFRAEAKDIYVLHFFEESHEDAERTRREMKDWFVLHMPASRTEWMAPSEHSGFIMGGPTGLRVDFSEDDLAAFSAHWETPEGTSLDPRFQCYLIPYEDWFSKYGHFVPSLEKPPHVAPALWIDTPLGVLTHVLPDTPEMQVLNHPAQYGDLWMHAVKLWPALAPLDVHSLVHGRVFRIDREPAGSLVQYSDTPSCPLLPKRQAEILAWLGLPANTRMVSEF